MTDDGTSPSSERPEGRPTGDRRGWLYATAVAVVVIIALIAFAATRGGDGGDGGDEMPGMDMGGTDGIGAGGGADFEVLAYVFNQQVPGPRLQLTQGDRVRIRVTNDLPEPTSVHWHAADITQEPIAPGRTVRFVGSGAFDVAA